jgi:hypothetical protein
VAFAWYPRISIITPEEAMKGLPRTLGLVLIVITVVSGLIRDVSNAIPCQVRWAIWYGIAVIAWYEFVFGSALDETYLRLRGRALSEEPFDIARGFRRTGSIMVSVMFACATGVMLIMAASCSGAER